MVRTWDEMTVALRSSRCADVPPSILGVGVESVAVGDEVIGCTNNRASHAEYVLVEPANLTVKPVEVPWEVAGAPFATFISASRREVRRDDPGLIDHLLAGFLVPQLQLGHEPVLAKDMNAQIAHHPDRLEDHVLVSRDRCARGAREDLVIQNGNWFDVPQILVEHSTVQPVTQTKDVHGIDFKLRELNLTAH
jgi:hypothetical protein